MADNETPPDVRLSIAKTSLLEEARKLSDAIGVPFNEPPEYCELDELYERFADFLEAVNASPEANAKFKTARAANGA